MSKQVTNEYIYPHLFDAKNSRILGDRNKIKWLVKKLDNSNEK